MLLSCYCYWYGNEWKHEQNAKWLTTYLYIFSNGLVHLIILIPVPVQVEECLTVLILLSNNYHRLCLSINLLWNNKFTRDEQLWLIRLRFERCFSHHLVQWWKEYLLKRSLIKHSCSWCDKIIVLWTLNQQAKIILRKLIYNIQ